jgi:hypothetical protein
MVMSQDGDKQWDELRQQWVPATPGFEASSVSPVVAAANNPHPTPGYSSPIAPMLETLDKKRASNANVVTERISDRGWLVSQILVTTAITLGFIMLILSSTYDYSANYTEAPDNPDAPQSSDFDIDGVSGLSVAEDENYSFAVDIYQDAMEIYYDDLEEHNKLILKYQGKSILMGQLGPGLIVLGLIYLCFQDSSKEMPKGLRMALIICTFYLLVNYLGYGAGLNGGLNFGAGN